MREALVKSCNYKTSHLKTRVPDLSCGITCVLIQYRNVTDTLYIVLYYILYSVHHVCPPLGAFILNILVLYITLGTLANILDLCQLYPRPPTKIGKRRDKSFYCFTLTKLPLGCEYNHKISHIKGYKHFIVEFLGLSVVILKNGCHTPISDGIIGRQLDYYNYASGVFSPLCLQFPPGCSNPYSGPIPMVYFIW